MTTQTEPPTKTGAPLPEMPLDVLVAATTREGYPEFIDHLGGWCNALHNNGLLMLCFNRSPDGRDPSYAGDGTPEYGSSMAHFIEFHTLVRILAVQLGTTEADAHDGLLRAIKAQA
jgi:hypothetical protein